MARTTLKITVAEEQAGRIDLVVRNLCEASRSQVRGMFEHGCVSVNGRRCQQLATAVNVGDVVALNYDPDQRYREKKKQWSDRTFQVVFEDDHLIVVDKAAAALTIPTDRNEANTLIERVSVYLSHSRRNRLACLVHRLDRDVSGLVVFGKHQPVADRLIEQFKQRQTSRVYTAIVAGVAQADWDVYRVLQRGTDTTLLEATLEAGQRNQVRVDLGLAGHPVLGDPRCRTKQAQHPRWNRKRIALHASSLGFLHPVTGEAVQFDSPLPTVMKRFMAGSRKR